MNRRRLLAGVLAAWAWPAFVFAQAGSLNIRATDPSTGITRNIGDSTNNALRVNIVAGTSRIADGSGNSLTSAARGSERALSVQIVDGSGAQITTFGGAGGTSSNYGSAFPSAGTAFGFSDGTNMQGARVADLDTGAGTAYGIVGNLVRRASGGPAELIGQSTMANSLPIVMASDQTPLPIFPSSPAAGTYLPMRITDGSGFVTPAVDYIHNVALTVATTAGPAALARASAAAPTDVGADDRGVLLWALRSGALVQQPSYGGVLGVVGNGASGTGVPRVTLANDSTGILASVTSITGFNSTTMTLGAGAVGAGSPRVTLASDDPAVTSLASIATYLQPSTGALIRSDNTDNDDETEIKATAGVLLAISGRNTHASADAFVRCTNATAASTTPGSTTVIYEMLLPFGGGFVQSSLGPGGRTFSTALTCYLATGEAASDTTDPAQDDVVVNIDYR